MEYGNSEKVRHYFDGAAERFDAIYRKEKAISQRLVDHLFRRVVHQRFGLVLSLCGEVSGKQVLDVGCGSGRYAIEFARRGARVVGVDFAPAMIEIAQKAAEDSRVAEACRFIQADFLKWREPHPFDICLAIGFFDYIEEPDIFLDKMARLTTEQALFSFPIRWRMRSLTRWMRLSLHRCPVRFYDEAEIAGLFHRTGWKSFSVHRLSRDYLVDARTG